MQISHVTKTINDNYGDNKETKAIVIKSVKITTAEAEGTDGSAYTAKPKTIVFDDLKEIDAVMVQGWNSGNQGGDGVSITGGGSINFAAATSMNLKVAYSGNTVTIMGNKGETELIKDKIVNILAIGI